MKTREKWLLLYHSSTKFNNFITKISIRFKRSLADVLPFRKRSGYILTSPPSGRTPDSGLRSPERSGNGVYCAFEGSYNYVANILSVTTVVYTLEFSCEDSLATNRNYEQ